MIGRYNERSLLVMTQAPSIFKFSHSFRFGALVGNLTIRFRNSNAELFNYGNVHVYSIEEESGTSAGGRMCECLDGQMATSAVEWKMIFSCPVCRRISVTLHHACVDDTFAIEICEVHGRRID